MEVDCMDLKIGPSSADRCFDVTYGSFTANVNCDFQPTDIAMRAIIVGDEPDLWLFEMSASSYVIIYRVNQGEWMLVI